MLNKNSDAALDLSELTTPDLSDSETSTSDDEDEPVKDEYGQIHQRETPKFISLSLSNLDKKLQKIPDGKKEAWALAQNRCPDLVGDSHKLMFLRCEVFDIDRTSRRLVKYWRKRLNLFGEDKAFKALTIKNCFPDEIERAALSNHFLQVVPIQENTGRGVLLFTPAARPETKTSIDIALRVVWYKIHAVLESETAQQKGIISFVDIENYGAADLDKKWARNTMEAVRGVLPIRISAFKLYHTPSIIKLFWPFIYMCIGPILRKRVFIISGENEEIVQKMQIDGMSVEEIPSQLGGSLQLDQNTWVEERYNTDL